MTRLDLSTELEAGETDGMNPPPNPSYRHRFPAKIISHAVWLYHIFSLSPWGRFWALTHMWNGPDGKWFLRSVCPKRTVQSYVRPLIRSYDRGHDDIRNARSPNQFCALGGAVRQTV